MKSPFPGMDPYIEACGLWEGFHNHLICEIDRAIASLLPHGYISDIAVRRYTVLLGPEAENTNLSKPDVVVAVIDEDTGPVPMQAFIIDRLEESFVEVYAEGNDRIPVTCIEVLSPSNKRRGTNGWQEYERKRQALLLGTANFIEIDLLRGGDRMPMLTPWPDSPYALLVCRSESAPHCNAWPAHFRRRLPVIPVPLLAPDADLSLDLQPLIDGIFSLGRYNERIDYSRPLTPPLPEADARWVQETLKSSPKKRGRSQSPRGK